MNAIGNEFYKNEQVRKERVKVASAKALEYMNSDAFMVEDITIEESNFSATGDSWSIWIIEGFTFEGITTNIPESFGEVEVTAYVDPSYLDWKCRAKKNKTNDRSLATRTADIKFFLSVNVPFDDELYTTVPVKVPANKISAVVRRKIEEACIIAIDEYIDSHITETFDYMNGTVDTYYVSNLFLDNYIGSFNFIYDEGKELSKWILNHRVEEKEASEETIKLAIAS